jgi:hypothetical protein
MMRKTRDINDVRVAMLAIGVSFVSLFLFLPLVYIFVYHYVFDTELSGFMITAMSFVIMFLFLLSTASLLFGIASLALNVYYRLSHPRTAKN